MFSVEIAALITDRTNFALIFVISSPLQSKFWEIAIPPILRLSLLENFLLYGMSIF